MTANTQPELVRLAVLRVANVRLGSKDEMLASSRCFPLCPQQRTSLNTAGMSVRCHKETHASQKMAARDEPQTHLRLWKARLGFS
jgi:hypothetical protein